MQYPQVRGLYLCTEDPAVLSELSAYANGTLAKNFDQLYFVHNQTRYANGSVFLARNSTYINSTEEALGAIRDIILMSEGNLFIGSISSFFGRAAIRLMMASRRLWEWSQIRSVDADPFTKSAGPGFPFQFSYRQ